MASGIGVLEECTTAFMELLKDRKYSALLLKISDDLTSVVVDKTIPPATGPPEAAYKAFMDELPEADCRFAIYDFEYVTQDVTKNRVIMILWSPDGSKIKSKMMYASSKQAVLNTLEGIQTQIQGSDYDEISYKAVYDNLVKLSVKY